MEEEKFRLMLVDDEPWALIGLEEIINWEEMGFTVVARCECGQEALLEAERVRPEAVITDIRMPDMSGIELYQQLIEKYPQMVGAVVSAYADFDIAKEAIRLAVLYYVLKPLQAQEVAEMASMLKQKLMSLKASAQNVEAMQIDPEAPVFPVKPGVGRPGFLLLTKSRQRLEQLKDAPGILANVQVGDYAGLLLDELPQELPEEIGISRAAYDFSDGKQLLRDAVASLNGGFRFCEKTSLRHMSSAGDIQLYLYEHLSEEISLKKLAGEFYLTETYLCDMFKKQTGKSIFGFLKHIRLYRAKSLMQTPQGEALTFKEIAGMCGYQDYSYFGQQFKKVNGMSPEAYRRLLITENAAGQNPDRE